MDTDEIVRFLEEQYDRVRVLPDGTIAVCHNLLTTRSVMLDVDEWNWKRRFCFAQRDLADKFFDGLESAQDVPNGGYVARRPPQEDQADPYLNQLHNRPWNKVYEKGA